MEEIQISVRKLIEFVMRSGDIDTSYRSNQRMVEGIRAHQRIQKAYGKGYSKEMAFQNKTEVEGIVFFVEGRADGVYESKDQVIIDEIKSTTRVLEEIDPDHNPLHWAQAKCYAYFYCKSRKREEIDVQLTYVNLDEEVEFVKFLKTYSREELEDFYLDLLSRYVRFSKALVAWRNTRNYSIKDLAFPYPTYRKGQREMSVGIYQAIEEGKRLFIEAPTGIGKTMSAIVPAISSMLSFSVNKIFYLTARTTLQREAKKAIQVLTDKGLKLKGVQITAKERICLNDVVHCNPEECPYAKGHFDRVNDAIIDIFREENLLSQDIISQYAEKHQVCPHEFQLDMTDYSDFILCDYNYVFDPRVYLRRAFEEENPRSVLLVDEAHNLVDRGRDMYSAELRKSQILRLMEIFPRSRNKKIYEKARSMLAWLESFFKQAKNKELSSKIGEGEEVSDQVEIEVFEDGSFEVVEKVKKKKKKSVEVNFDQVVFESQRNALYKMATRENPEELYLYAKSLMTALDPFLAKEKTDPDYKEVLQNNFDLAAYTKIYELWQDGFVNLLIEEEEDLVWKIQCVDTSELFQHLLSRVRSAIFFSATLSPSKYYQDLLGGGDKALVMHLDSPFPSENLKILQLDISTRYKDRPRTMDPIVENIHSFMNKKAGNYMIFFPSYAYLENFQETYQDKYEEEIFIQGRNLTQFERQEILDTYEEEQNVKGGFVLGGLFSEGIDLLGESLIGVVVVSVGLPGISFERDVIKHFFDQEGKSGFDYAYTYPGMNKILQAAGRVIRSEEDKGAILLIDDRFSQRKYRALMPRHWQNIEKFRN